MFDNIHPNSDISIFRYFEKVNTISNTIQPSPSRSLWRDHREHAFDSSFHVFPPPDNRAES